MPKKRENGEGNIYFDKSRNKYCAEIHDQEGNRPKERFNTRE